MLEGKGDVEEVSLFLLRKTLTIFEYPARARHWAASTLDTCYHTKASSPGEKWVCFFTEEDTEVQLGKRLLQGHMART